MKLYSENDSYKIYNGDMLDMLQVIKPESIDAIVCDPPYELGFMIKVGIAQVLHLRKKRGRIVLRF